MKFRNPAGVAQKLSNFLGLDPEYEGSGQSHRSRLDAVVWEEYAQDREALRRVAEAIRKLTASGALADVGSLPDEEEEAQEGRMLTRVHRYRERKGRQPRLKTARSLRSTRPGPCSSEFLPRTARGCWRRCGPLARSPCRKVQRPLGSPLEPHLLRPTRPSRPTGSCSESW